MQQQQSFDMSQPAPRVNGALMGRFVGKRVKLVGQIISATGGVMELKAADEQTVHVNLAGPAPGGIYVEFEGIVESPNTIKEESHTLFSENFDLANYNELCKLACGNFTQLFGAST